MHILTSPHSPHNTLAQIFQRLTVSSVQKNQCLNIYILTTKPHNMFSYCFPLNCIFIRRVIKRKSEDLRPLIFMFQYAQIPFSAGLS